MIRPLIKSLEITEVPDLNPNDYSPNDLEDFCCTLGLTIGPDGSDGGELFYLTVCTPKWLARVCEENGFAWGRHHLIVPEYSLSQITQRVTRFVENSSGSSWSEVATKLSRIASWEFEDYAEPS
jgi:hypothetical protein